MAPEDNPADDEPIDRQSYAFCLMLDACRSALEVLGKEVCDDSTPRDAELAERLEATCRLIYAIEEAEGFLRSMGVNFTGATR